MGKPRLIIIARHAQSEGNENRAIHQTIPDHRVKLTKEGNRQALEAGERLRALLEPDDTVRIITSPYTRTRETTEGIVKSLSPHPNSSKIKVYEEPRIREQDFGNFQPCSEEMERMWHERAAYGHFFYRIPNGESAADAYDRVSSFNESLWRQFADDDFPSVLVLVTHGLMARIFLMKWYHYSVEYFEDLRNVNHCEFVLMERDAVTDKYILQNKLRTWSAYRKEQEGKRAKEGNIPKIFKKLEAALAARGTYGGCANGCNHPKINRAYKTNRINRSSNSKTNGNTNNGVTTRANRAVAQELRDKLKVLEGGRDFGGSRSGAGSRIGSEDEASGSDDELPLEKGVCGGYISADGEGYSSDPSDMMERMAMRDQSGIATSEEVMEQAGEQNGANL